MRPDVVAVLNLAVLLFLRFHFDAIEVWIRLYVSVGVKRTCWGRRWWFADEKEKVRRVG